MSGGSRGTFTRDGDKGANHPPSRVVFNKKGTTSPAVVLEKKKFIVFDPSFYDPENLATLRKFDTEGQHFKDLHEMDRPFLPTYVMPERAPCTCLGQPTTARGKPFAHSPQPVVRRWALASNFH